MCENLSMVEFLRGKGISYEEVYFKVIYNFHSSIKHCFEIMGQ